LSKKIRPYCPIKPSIEAMPPMSCQAMKATTAWLADLAMITSQACRGTIDFMVNLVTTFWRVTTGTTRFPAALVMIFSWEVVGGIA
jgi:hypothetical protein